MGCPSPYPLGQDLLNHLLSTKSKTTKSIGFFTKPQLDFFDQQFIWSQNQHVVKTLRQYWPHVPLSCASEDAGVARFRQWQLYEILTLKLTYISVKKSHCRLFVAIIGCARGNARSGAAITSTLLRLEVSSPLPALSCFTTMVQFHSCWCRLWHVNNRITTSPPQDSCYAFHPTLHPLILRYVSLEFTCIMQYVTAGWFFEGNLFLLY